MKFIKAIIYALYVIVYFYSSNKIAVEPDNVFWGYLCVLIFTFLFIWTVIMIVKHSENQKK